LSKLGPAKNYRRDTRRNVFEALCRALEQSLARKGAERRLFGGLPNERVAANKGDGSVPCPHRGRKIKGRDDACDAERMPRLHHSVARPFARERQTIELARKSRW